MNEKRLIQRPSKEELFTDRQKFLDAFEGALKDLTPDAPKVLVFHGPPGIGKTAIREELIRRLGKGEYPGADAWGLSQFDAETRAAPDVALAILSGGLNASGGVSFPSFEIGSAVYWRKKSPHLELNQQNFVGFKAASLAFNVAGAFVPGVSLGSIITDGLDQLHSGLRDRVRNWWRSRGREYLRGIEYLEDEDILKKLPFYFGKDITDYLNNNKKAVIFLDGYESVWLSESRTRYSDDAWVRNLIENCAGALFVIGTRRPVKWDEIDGPEGKYWVPFVEQLEVPDFIEAYTRELLAKAKITDEAIVKAVAEGSEGVPLYIDLCIDIYYGELARGNTPGPDDFPRTHQEIFERFIRDIDVNEQAALEVVSCARFFDRDIFETLIDEFNIAYSATNFPKFVGFSFMREGDVADTYRIHDLLSTHLQKYVDPELRAKVHRFLFEHYRETAEVDDPKAITEENIRALGETVHHGLGTGDAEGAVEWFCINCHPYESAALYGELEPLYVKLIDEAEPVLGVENISLAAALNNLAGLYKTQSRYSEAEPLYVRSLEIKEKALGPDQLDVAITLNNLAALYDDQGRYDEAEPLYVRSLEIKEKALGPDHPEVATTLNNVAGLYQAQGRYDAAEPLYKRSLEIKEKALGPDHPKTATTLNNLAEVYRAQSRYAKAEPLYLKTLEIYEKALAPDHPLVATTLNNLAILNFEQGNPKAALKYQERAHEIFEKRLPANHTSIINSYMGLSIIYDKLNQPEEAAEYARRAEELQRSREEDEEEPPE